MVEFTTQSGKSHAPGALVELANSSFTKSLSSRCASVMAWGVDSEIDIIGLSQLGWVMTAKTTWNWCVRSAAMRRRNSVWQLDWSASVVMTVEKSGALPSACAAVPVVWSGAPTEVVTGRFVSVELVTGGSRMNEKAGIGSPAAKIFSR